MINFYDDHDGHSTCKNHNGNMSCIDDCLDNHHRHIKNHMGGSLLQVGDEYAYHEDGQNNFSDYDMDNSNLIMSYQDPLIHSNNYLMEPFNVLDDTDVLTEGYTGDTNSMLPIGVNPYIEAYAVAPDGGLMPDISSTNDLDGVKNGMLEDNRQLDNIIAIGEVQGTHHVDSDHLTRSETTKSEFLHLNGYTSIPAGYEIHHIVPLSEGGADDVHNMILLRTDEHAAVTTAHRQYYGWGV